MMGTIFTIWKAAGGWRTLAGLAAGLLLGFVAGQVVGAKNQKAHEEADRALAITEALQDDVAAKEVSAEQRLKDAATVAEMTERLTDAVASNPDQAPSVRRVAVECERLRQAYGADFPDLPLVCRPQAGPQAQAAP